MRVKRWIRVVVLTMTAIAFVIASPVTRAAEPFSPATDDANSVNHLLAILQAGNSTVADREDAAQKLTRQDTPDAKAILLSLLQAAGNRDSQIAIAKALAQLRNPDPSFIPALGELLGVNRNVTDASAYSLASYGDNAEAFRELSVFVDDIKKPWQIRIGAIGAIGSLTQPAAADYLISLLTNANQSAPIQNAAAEALGEMTGLTGYGTDTRQWQQWWNDNRTKTPDQFRAQLLTNRARLFNLAKQRNAQMVDETSQLLKSDYNLIPDSRKTEVLLSYLTNRAPDIRIVGLDIADGDFSNLTDTVRSRLVTMISDPDDNVRMHAVTSQLTINNHSALAALIKQVKVETDVRIKVKLATALGRVEDAGAAPALLDLLKDSKLEVVTAAARAMAGHFGEKLRQTDSYEANRISDQLRNILTAKANEAGTDEFRTACLSALAALRDPQSFDTFRQFLRPDETADVRRATILGLGNLGNTNADAIVANQLDDPERTIRLEAARAMGAVATAGQDQLLYDKMTSDSDADVRAALWEALRKLYSQETPDQLQHWAEKFKGLADKFRDNDTDKWADKWLATLQQLGALLEQKQELQAVAENEQAIADAMVAVKPPQKAEAITVLEKAMEYWRGPGKGRGDQIETLIGQLLDLKLDTAQYAAAAKFAAEQITYNKMYQQTVGPRIKGKADELSNNNNIEAAKSLISEALKMSPPLEDKYIQQIQQIQNDLKQKAAQPPGP